MNIKKTTRGAVLSEAAMLTSVRISMFNPLRDDREASRELAHTKGASTRRVKVKKRIFDNCFPKTRQQAAFIRNGIMYKYTFELPKNGGGQQKGPRLLPTRIAEKFLDEITSAMDDFNHYADEECADLEKYLDSERESFGDLFKETDYSWIQSIRNTFNVEVAVDPIPSVEGINVGRHNDRMRAQSAERQSKMIAEMNKQLLATMLEHVSHVANVLDKDRTCIFPSLLGNVRELVQDIIPACNVNDDPEITSLCNDLKKVLRYNDDQIKNSESAKKMIQKVAKSTAKKVAKAAKDAGVTKDDLTTTCRKKAASYF